MKLQLKRSVVLDGGKAKEPTASQLDYGELAINYNADDPVLFMKTSDNAVIRVTAIGIPDIDDPSYQPNTLDERFVNLDGDTMTGYLVLNADPTLDLHPATKKYVDDQLTATVPPATEINASPPSTAVEGQLWWDTTDGRLYIYYEDIDSSQWVPATPESESLKQVCPGSGVGYDDTCGVKLNGDWSNIPILPEEEG